MVGYEGSALVGGLETYFPRDASIRRISLISVPWRVGAVVDQAPAMRYYQIALHFVKIFCVPRSAGVSNESARPIFATPTLVPGSAKPLFKPHWFLHRVGGIEANAFSRLVQTLSNLQTLSNPSTIHYI
jgi:hypothetical protein